MFVLKRGRCCFTKRLVHQYFIWNVPPERRLCGMKCRWRFYFDEMCEARADDGLPIIC